MQFGISVAYNIREVKPDNIKHWICVHREEFVSCDSILKLQVGLVIGCVILFLLSTCSFNILSQLTNFSLCTRIQWFALSGFTSHIL